MAENRVTLRVPWDLYSAELKTMFASDGCVKVHHAVVPPGGTPPHVIRIDVCTDEEGQALATLLRHISPGIAEVQVFGPDGNPFVAAPLPSTPRGWIRLFNTAFEHNCLIIRSFRGEVSGRDVAFVEVANTTLQFFAENAADPNGNVTLLPALAFFDNLNPSPDYQLFTSAIYASGCGGEGK